MKEQLDATTEMCQHLVRQQRPATGESASGESASGESGYLSPAILAYHQRAPFAALCGYPASHPSPPPPRELTLMLNVIVHEYLDNLGRTVGLLLHWSKIYKEFNETVMFW